MASINFEFLHDEDDGDRKDEDGDANQGQGIPNYSYVVIFWINEC